MRKRRSKTQIRARFTRPGYPNTRHFSFIYSHSVYCTDLPEPLAGSGFSVRRSLGPIFFWPKLQDLPNCKHNRHVLGEILVSAQTRTLRKREEEFSATY